MDTNRIKMLCCRLMDMTEAEYENDLFETGMAYLEQRHTGDVDLIAALQSMPQFWKWWSLQWAQRSQALLEKFNYSDATMVTSHLVRRNARACFIKTHGVVNLQHLYSRTVTIQALRNLLAQQEESQPGTEDRVVKNHLKSNSHGAV